MTAPKTLRVENVPLSQCIAMAHKGNPKEHDIPALIASLSRFGFTAPPMIDEATKIMVAGHGRCEALAKMKADGVQPPANIVVEKGEWLVPVFRGVAFKNDRERDAYVIADNQHTIHGGWDFDKLSTMLADIRVEGVEGFGFDGMGFDAPELDNLLAQYNTEPGDDDDEKPEKPKPDKFVKHDITVDTTYCCPKCGYEWSGKAK